MLNLYLMRHGQSLDNLNGVLGGRRDEPLTPLGESQVLAAAQFLKGLGVTFDAIYTSPLERAKHSTDIVRGVLKLSWPEVVDDLTERDVGTLTGEPVSRIEELCAPNILKTEESEEGDGAESVTYFLSAKGAETFPQMMTRARRLLKRIAVRYPHGNIILVTHGDIGKMLYASYYDFDWKEVLTAFNFGNADILLLSADAVDGGAHIYKAEIQTKTGER